MSIELVTPTQLAELWQVNKDWIYDQVAEGKLPHIRLGRNIRFQQGQLEAYLAGEWQPE